MRVGAPAPDAGVMPDTPRLHARGLVKRFGADGPLGGATLALAGVDLDVAPGGRSP